jgi:hypothetical protein
VFQFLFRDTTLLLLVVGNVLLTILLSKRFFFRCRRLMKSLYLFFELSNFIGILGNGLLVELEYAAGLPQIVADPYFIPLLDHFWRAAKASSISHGTSVTSSDSTFLLLRATVFERDGDR